MSLYEEQSHPGTQTEGGRSLAFALRSLTLAGFGVYSERTRFTFPAGPAVLIGPNESGKSTMLAGLAAVLFGLPELKDASKFGTARFRSLGHPKEFSGELEWETDGGRFRLTRHFDTHRVRLVVERDGKIEELFSGEHNPQGRSSAGQAFGEQLQRWIGLGTYELFEQTLCLQQRRN